MRAFDQASQALTEPTRRFCAACGAPHPPEAQFCPACGAAVAPRESHRASYRRDRTAVRAITWSFLAVIAILLLAGLLLPFDLGLLPSSLVVFLGNVAVALGTLRFLVGKSAREAFGDPPLALDLVTAAFVAAATLGVSLTFVGLIVGGELRVTEVAHPVGAVILGIAVLPALGEEFLCRGAQWSALEPSIGPKQTILVTALVFALLHGLSGGFLLELPHRFLVGIALGWLRHHTGSLWPPVLAHFLHNFGAIWLELH